MTNREILEKAIQKAIDGGWQPYYTDIINDSQKIEVLDWLIEINDLEKQNIKYKDYFEFIFNHDFAKALWGDESYYFTENCEWISELSSDKSQYLMDIPSYKYHLQQVVISDDPIKYIGEHLND